MSLALVARQQRVKLGLKTSEPDSATLSYGVADKDGNVVLDGSTGGGQYVRKTDSYTLKLDDVGAFIDINNAGATTWTIPPDSSVPFPIGTEIAGGQYGLGTVTVTGGAGVTIDSTDDLVETAGPKATFAVKKTGANEWRLAGKLA